MGAHAAGTEGEVAILSRLIRPERSDLNPEAARSILKLGFSDQDHARMHDLTVKSQQGVLGDAEQESLENYRRVGRLLELMHAKARLSLKRAGLSG